MTFPVPLNVLKTQTKRHLKRRALRRAAFVIVVNYTIKCNT